MLGSQPAPWIPNSHRSSAVLPLSTHQCPTCSCPAPLRMPLACPVVPVGLAVARRVHAPCKEHAGIHDSSAQHGHCGVLCLQVILPDPREADSEVLPLVQHCREVEVRRACIMAQTVVEERDTHLSLGGGWTVRRR